MSWQEFHLLRPLWLLALIPLGWLLWELWRSSGGASAWNRVCDPRLLPHLLVDAGGEVRRAPLLLLSAAWVIGVLALAGPTWERWPQPVYRTQSARVLVLDLSRSMGATDVKPSRLKHARFKLLDLLKRSREGQTALVVYAGDAHVVSPLTDDSATIAAMVPSLSSDIMPVRGSNAAQALRQAGALLRQAGTPEGEVLLIADGLDDPASALAAARGLRAQGARLSVLAVGTAQGAPVPLPGGGFLKDGSGAIVVPRLEAEPLQQLAATGGGVYVASAPGDRDLSALRRITEASGETRRSDQQTHAADRWREEGPYLVLLLLPLAALAFRRGWLMALALLVLLPPPQTASAMDWRGLWWRPDQQGAQAMAAGKPEQAAKLFEDPRWKAAAAYRAGHYQKAAELLAKRQDPETAYNRGNALARAGKLEDALHAYDQALKDAPHDADAEHNRELVRKLLEQQRRKAQQQGQQGKQGQQTGKGQDKQGSQAKQAQGGKQSGKGQDQKGSQGKQAQSGKQSGAQQQAAGNSKKGAEPQAGSQATEQPKGTDQSNPQAGTGKQDRQAGAHRAPKQKQQAGTASEAQEPKREQAQGNQQQAAPAPDREPRPTEVGKKAQEGRTAGETEGAEQESRQALRQWLRRIPDDPGGLLRRKFLLEQQRNHMAREARNPW